MLTAQPELVGRYLALPCQTNEVGRSAVLLTGLLVVAAVTGRPVRLLEVGASAGLNLRFDAYRYVAPAAAWGPPHSKVRLVDPWDGGAPDLTVPLRVVDRAGCDRDPVDPTSPEGRLRLCSSVWADQVQRFEQLRGALAVAARAPAQVERASASAWLARRLARPVEGAATVVWHSVVWQYLEPAERRAADDVIAEAAAGATPDAPVAVLAMEYDAERRTGGLAFPVTLNVWPGGERRHLADAGGHGPPVRLRG